MKHLTILRKLTDVFTKNPDSNIGKLFLIISEQFSELEESATKVENWRDIDQAQGTTLDLMGKSRGQHRGQATDEIMRILIKTRLARNSSDGTINNIINALALSLGVSPSQLHIKALWAEGEPAALMIDKLPLSVLNSVGMTTTELGLLAQSITAGGIRITSINLSGTFVLSSQANVLENSIDFGLAPLDQSTGGTLGATYNPNHPPQLPI